MTTSIPPVSGNTTVPVVRDNAHVRTNSAIMYRLGGREYPMRTVPQCKVCQSHYRVEIERGLIKSYGYTAIHRSLPEQAKTELSIRNIEEHAKRHLPVDEGIRRAVIEARAREIGVSVEDSHESLVDHISFARVGLGKVYEAMANGDLNPDVKDGIAFANLLLKVEERAGGGVDDEMMFGGFMAYLKAIRSVCTPEQVREIGAQLQQDPTMRALLTRSQRTVEAGDSNDA